MFDWLIDLYNQFALWLQSQFSSITDALNPVLFINSIVVYVASLLPDGSTTTASIVASVIGAVQPFLVYVSMADYFVNVPFLLTVLALMLTIETALLFVRVWRFLRSFIT